ncbi:hypothetical protein SAMN06265379_10386 [Saccharicrinis carchari]|uniref:Uncharacterized protein n=1 Tax=Saccharicrinis carchari TaxID=1168039 RepID=A0A521CFC2_SACCC|nr:hypothetical protein [Saccharicrinis carchari]SMO58119.1 hypothetical protein SAMN06265379_10386 [Saccharicrinis carchari]
MRNIFFIHRFPFSKEAFIRDEFEYFIDKGYNVKYLDISNLLKKKNIGVKYPETLQEHIIPFESKKEFGNFLMDNKEGSVIVTDVGLLSNSAWMYVAVFKAKLPYILFEHSVLPRIRTTGKQVSKVSLLKIGKRFRYEKIYKKPAELLMYWLAKTKLYPAEVIITSKPKLSSEKRTLRGPKTIIKYTASLDYNAAMAVGDEITVNEPYAVFVDQYFVHHPDFKTNHIVHFFSAEEYYGELNKFLNDFSAHTGLKMVIASHPRRSEEQAKDFDPEFEIYYNKTAELVKNSTIALIHFSTAINYAVIFKKPFMLLNSSLFKNSNVSEEVMRFSKYFNKEAVNMSDYENVLNSLDEKIYDIDESKYKAFLDLYIKHPNAENETFKHQIEFALARIDTKLD